MAGLALAIAGVAATAETLPPPPVSPTPVAKYEYDAEGNPTKTVIAPGSRNLVTRHDYDSLGRRTSTTDAKNGLTQFGYDLQDQLTSVTDPRSLVTQYQPTGLGDVKQLVSPDSGMAISTYDAAGNLKTRIDARSVTATYSYDALNRLRHVVYSRVNSADRSYSWTYDQAAPPPSFPHGHGIGRLTTASFPEGVFWFSYDALGRVTQTLLIGPHGAIPSVKYGYTGSHLTSLTYPSGRTVQYGWANGQPVSTGVSAKGVVTALLDQVVMSPFGLAQSWTWRLGATEKSHERVYDASGRVVRLALGPLVRDITYDDANRVSRYTHYTTATALPAPAFDQSFSYDELGRLQLVTAATNWSYAYDAGGNRTASSVGSTARGYTVSATSNRLEGLTNPIRSMGYNGEGNTLTDVQSGSAANYTATYSLEGRLAALTQAGVGGVEFVYDNMGRRVRRSQWTGSPNNPRTVTLYVYDQDNHLLGEYTATGTPITEYIWLGDTPVGIIKSDAAAPGGYQVFAIHTDHLDTPRVITDAQGNVRWRWMGEPFGASPAEEQPTAGLPALQQNLRFPGQQYEPFGGRFYNHFRDYDPTTGRYVQSDPIGLEGGMNTYTYSNGNPTNMTDPLGLWSTEAHDYFIDTFFPHLPAYERSLIKGGSEYADSPLYQDGSHSFMHGMSSDALSQEKARKLFCKFLAEKMKVYARDLNRPRGVRNAYINLGMALHAIMDSTSPVHRGFQKWDSSQIEFHVPRKFGPLNRPNTREDIDVAPHYREQTHRRMRDLMNGQLPAECDCQ